MKRITRRKLLQWSATLGLGAAAASCTPSVSPASEIEAETPTSTKATTSPTSVAKVPSTATPVATQPGGNGEEATSTEGAQASTRPELSPTPPEAAYLAAVHGSDPEAITRRAVAAIGGMGRFVKAGDDVIVKPNICNANHTFEYASTTNPQVVATLVALCLEADAERVRVMDNPFSGTAQRAYERSGIAEAVEAVGGRMELMGQHRYVEVDIPEGKDLDAWLFYQPILEADVVIDVPIAKHHSLARLTLGGKNLMGTIENRPAMHRNLGQRIADITSLVRPQLTVMDAVRMLMDHGPTGGNLDDVKRADIVIASHDLVAVDAYTTTLFEMAPEDISYIVASAEMGLGDMDLGQLEIQESEI